MKILLTIDGSSCSDKAVDEIARRPWPAGSVVRVLYAIEPLNYIAPEAGVVPQSYFDGMETAAREYVNRAVSTLEGKAGRDLKVETMIITGYPKQVILDEAEGWGADLIVVGSHGYGKWERLLLGSVSQVVATHAKCSVEIVRCR